MSAGIVVVGGGMAGCAAAWALAERGEACTVVESTHPGNPAGGSSGTSRMFRRMYSDAYYARLARASLRAWRRLEADSGNTLLAECGLLFFGDRGEKDSVEGNIPGARRVMREQNVPFDEPDTERIAARWPLRPPENSEGLFEATAGTLHSRRALEVMAGRAVRAGADFLNNETVTGIHGAASGRRPLTVTLRSGRVLAADRVVLAAGAWTNRLLAHLGFRIRMELWGMLWAHYAVDASLAASYPQWFCFKPPSGADEGLYYGFPAEGDPPVIKTGVDWCPPAMRATDPDRLPDAPDPEVARLLDTFLHTHLTGVRHCVGRYVSPYAMTADNGFVLDTVPADRRITVFAGDCGHAFKFAPVLGHLMADLVLGRPPAIDPAPLSITRDAVGLTAI
ncbi:FAD-dependent oxidoreductase [Streptomyces griseocarneus]|uniref:FAD-dependent oxidoreductase n=1 Tax=Streptomyces griseocarneus TaxID=51201 RepID=UPI00167CE34D|nr:FAD-dependent oxidoreductase [Streptomyces griseocarneus]MBZ6476329.1 FAD-dependent oxidoreductase [Streptomyces griseocarneus]GHG78153.1 N-methyl-L-tryptophan oxidase [Streptomyces griseocarneus]